MLLDEIGDQIVVSDLTTPGTFWLNHPVAMDADGNRTGRAIIKQWYEDDNDDVDVDVDPP